MRKSSESTGPEDDASFWPATRFSPSPMPSFAHGSFQESPPENGMKPATARTASRIAPLPAATTIATVSTGISSVARSGVKPRVSAAARDSRRMASQQEAAPA